MAARRVAVVAALILLGCDASHSLVVDVKTDLVPREEFQVVRTVVSDASSDRVLREQERTAEPGAGYLAGVRSAEFAELDPGVYLVRVELLGFDGRQRIQRSVLVQLAQSTAVTVLLTRTCVGVACPDDGGDSDATECLAGRCVAPTCVGDRRAPDRPASDPACCFGNTCALG
jgi:hypothetical protein